MAVGMWQIAWDMTVGNVQVRGARKALVVVTSHEFLLRDAARLKAVRWHYIVIDEGHRLKNSECKLNRTLKSYSAAHRLLLTGIFPPMHSLLMCPRLRST